MIWHKFPEEQPSEENKYLVVDARGNITIKKWLNKRKIETSYSKDLYDEEFIATGIVPAHFTVNSTRSRSYSRDDMAKNVFYWMPLPDLPEEMKRDAEADAIRRKIAALNRKLSKLMSEYMETEE